jgi:hypothetical protein
MAALSNGRRSSWNFPGGTSERHYVVTEKKKYSGFAAFRIMPLYNPLTYFVILFTLLGAHVFYFHHHSLRVISYYVLFSPAYPHGAAVLQIDRTYCHSIFPGDNCAVNFSVQRAEK